MTRLVLGLTLAVAACAPAHPRAPAPLDPVALFARLAPSVVYTRASYHQGDDITVDTGVGVVIGPDGLILSSCHQLTHSDDGDRARTVEVLLAEPDPLRHTFRPSAPLVADVIACSDQPDLGLLKLRGGDHGRVPVPLATALPRPGEVFAVIGATHLGFLWSVQECLASGIGDQRETGTAPYGAVSPESAEETRKGMTPGTVIQSGCHVNPMSGSPAVDATGRIVGLHLFSRYNTDEPPEEVNYYLGADEIERFVRPHLAPPAVAAAPR